MKKKVMRDYMLRKGALLTETELASIYRLKDGSILKFFHSGILEEIKGYGIDIESKVLAAVPLKESPEILVPTAATYNKKGQFSGYIMPEAAGISYKKYDDNLTIEQREDLIRYARVHSNLEKILKKNSDIVFPDVCTVDNIYVDKDGNIQFIDYDGLQIGEYRATSLSSTIGSIDDYIEKSKYFTSDYLFTKELDKKSSLILYFLSAFNVNLNMVGSVNPKTRKTVTLEDIFRCINLDDPDLCHKACKIFNDDEPNEYLDDDVFRIAEKYDIKVVGQVGKAYMKRLSKKV